MAPETLLAPMGALAALTFLVRTFIPIARFRAAFAGRSQQKTLSSANPSAAGAGSPQNQPDEPAARCRFCFMCCA